MQHSAKAQQRAIHPRPVACGVGGVCALVLLAGVASASLRPWPASAAKATAALRAEALTERVKAAQGLTSLPRAKAIPLLAKALDDAAEEVRVAAAEGVLALAEQASVELASLELIAAEPASSGSLAASLAVLLAKVTHGLTDPALPVRKLAARALVRSGALPEQTAPNLVKALGDPDPELRVLLVRALGHSLSQSDNDAAVAALLGRMEDPRVEVCVAAVEELSYLRPARALAPLIGRLSDGPLEVRKAAALALGRWGDEAAVPALSVAARDSDDALRRGVVWALGETRSPAALLPLLAVLKDDVRLEVREAALLALGRLSSEAAVTQILYLLPALPVELRSTAETALISSGAVASSGLELCLVTAVSSAAAELCARVAAAVVPGSAPAWIVRALQAGGLNRSAALGALSQAGNAAAWNALLSHWTDPEGRLDKSALASAEALSLAVPGYGLAADPLAEVLKSGKLEPAQLPRWLKVLAQTRAARLQPVLLRYITQDTPRTIRIAALSALGEQTELDAKLLPQLLQALSDASSEVRSAAAMSLRKAAPAIWLEALLNGYERERVDRDSWLTAVAGAAARSQDAMLARRVARLVQRAAPPERDALLEVLSLIRGAEPELNALARELNLRQKFAEVAELTHLSTPELDLLLKDVRVGVRLNALWSLGRTGDVRYFSQFERMASDPDARVAGNAVAALGLLYAAKSELAPLKPRVKGALCRALQRPDVGLQANTLLALQRWSLRCGGQGEAALLRYATNAAVRKRAAWLLRSAPVGHDAAHLRRCAAEERDPEVALACGGGSAPPLVTPRDAAGGGPFTLKQGVTLFVQRGGQTPVPGASVLLESRAGFARAALTDQRGALFELEPPAPGFRWLE